MLRQRTKLPEFQCVTSGMSVVLSFINDELLIEMSVMMIAIKSCPKLCISNNKTQLPFPLPLYMRIPTHFSNEISYLPLVYCVQQYDAEFNCYSIVTDYFVHLR